MAKFSSAVTGKGQFFLVRAADAQNRPCYFVIRAANGQLRQLKDKEEGARLDMRDYGDIVASGFGHEVSAENKKHLQEKYGVDADALSD